MPLQVWDILLKEKVLLKTIPQGKVLEKRLQFLVCIPLPRYHIGKQYQPFYVITILDGLLITESFS